MTAVFSTCGQYRYLLGREAESMAPMKASALFVMLNPSTADATVDDPTLRRCRGFAKLWDCNGCTVVNVYALRATDPAELWTHADPVGPENDEWLSRAASISRDVVCAWGVHAQPERVEQVIRILTAERARLWCLGTTKDGAPRHPLYVRNDQQLTQWIPQ